jgi:hypothetical protein
LLADPPKSLKRQLDKCRADPGQWLRPTASAIAAEVYGSPHDWREVEPVLREYFGCDPFPGMV